MRIAIDARELAGQPTGVGRYLSEILEAWTMTPAATAHEFVLCAPSPIAVASSRSLRLSTAIASGRGTLWEQVTLPRLLARTAPDVLFAPAYTGPIRAGVPMVLTIHDVSFAAHPEWFGWREGVRRRVLTRLAARRAARVLTVSEFSRREIVRHLRVATDKIDVIYSGAPDRVSTDPQRVSGARATATGAAPLVLYVGSIFNRRHVPELIEGFTRLARRRPDVRLELVGDNRTHPRQDLDGAIARSPASSRMHAHAYVSDAELTRLYTEASAFVFLSEYEGFGFTPLEALSAGVPIVVLDTPVAREIYGDAAIYVARPDPALIEDALDCGLFDEQRRAAVLDAAASVLARYSWRDCAQRTLQAIVAAV